MKNRIIQIKWPTRKNGGMKFRTRLIVFFLVTAVIIILASIYTYVSSQILMQDTSEMFRKNMELTDAYNRIAKTQNDVELYLSTGSSDSLVAFYSDSGALKDNASKLLDEVTYTPRGIKIKNVSNMISNYSETAENAMDAKRGRNIDLYTGIYQNAVEEYNEISVYMEEIMSQDIIDNVEEYRTISQKQQRATTTNNFLIIAVIIYTIFMIVIFSMEITKPITKLASYANEISNGNFDVEISPAKSSREVNMLYRVFRSMATNVKDYVNELQEKRRLEHTLNEQMVNNLKMKNALHESELLALQSQVNPHFIFNTINIGAKIAMLQGDQTTCTYLENAADIFRYNLYGLDTNVTFKEELDNVVSYMYLLQTRFGDRVNFLLQADQSDQILMNYTVPRMILQPIVENAYIHGIGEMEEGGTIRVSAQRESGTIYISICDNGKGIKQEKIDEILNGSSENSDSVKSKKIGHISGIGVDNVLKRLRLFYGRQDVMRIECTGGETRFIFVLPVQRGG